MAATGSEIASAYVALTVKAPGIQKDIARELGGIDASGAGSQIGSKLADGMKKTLKVAGVGVAGVLGTALVKGFGRLKAIEEAQAKMRGLGHDADTVALAMDNSLNAVKGTAFGLGDAAGAASQLMAANIKPGKELEGVLKTVGNNASAAGVGFDEMGGIFAKAATQANGVQNDVIGQLADKGIPIYQALADQMGVTAGEVFKMASEGKVDFDTFAAAAQSAAGTVADEMGKTTTGSFDNLMAAMGRLGAKILEDVYPLIGPLFQDITKWLDEATTRVEPLVAEVGTNLKNAFAWLKENGEVIRRVATSVGLMVAAYFTIRGVIAVINGVKAALAVARAVQLGWNAATYGAAAASYASTTAAKVGLVAHKAWNAVVLIGKGIWALMNGSLIKSAALWVANTAKLVAHKVAVIANNAGLSLWLKIAATQLATGWKNVTMWVRNTAALVAHRVAVVAASAASKAAAAAQWLLNTAMKANPIMLIVGAITALVGGLIYFFTQTELGQAIWAEFTRFLGEAWTNIVSFFTTFGETVSTIWTGLWQGISSFFSGIWETLKLWVSTGLQWITDLWSSVWGGISTFFTDLWNGIVAWFQQKIAFWRAVFTLALVFFLKFWTDTWNNIKSFFSGLWNGIISWFQEKIAFFQLAFRLGLGVLRKTWENIWNGIKTFFSNIWTGIKSVFTTMMDFVKTKPKAAFEAARDGIGKAWKGIQDLAKKPVRFVIETVINGLINTINKIPGVNLAKVPLPKGFSEGGYTGNIAPNAVAGVVHGNEHVIRAESRRAIESRHPGLLDHMNQYGSIPGYRKGGLVNPLPQGSYSVSQPYHGGHNGIDLAAPSGTKVYAAGSGTVGLAGSVNMGGNEVYIQHDNGLGTRYSHLSRFGTRVGAKVKAGNVIGYVGSTGMSTGPHLHYEVYNPGGGAGNYGNHVNPAAYMGLQGKDLGEAGGAQSILDGLVDWAVGKIKGAFPEGGMWIDVASALAKDAAGKMAKAFNPFAAADGHTATLFDNGGWLQPGLSLVENKTGRPEPIFTGDQFDDLVTGRAGFSGPVRLVVGDREFDAYVEELADDRIDAAAESQEAAGRRSAYA